MRQGAFFAFQSQTRQCGVAYAVQAGVAGVFCGWCLQTCANALVILPLAAKSLRPNHANNQVCCRWRWCCRKGESPFIAFSLGRGPDTYQSYFLDLPIDLIYYKQVSERVCAHCMSSCHFPAKEMSVNTYIGVRQLRCHRHDR
jgi:hypothetical protein